MDEASKRAELLEQGIRAIKPRIAQFACPLTSSVHNDEEIGQYDIPHYHSEDFKERGVVLVDRYTVEERDRLKALVGTRLVLLTDGRLVELRRSGTSWNSGERWKVEMQILSAREAIDHYGLAQGVVDVCERRGVWGEAGNL